MDPTQTHGADPFAAAAAAIDVPNRSLWDKLVDLLSEIISFGSAETTTFNGAMSIEEEGRWERAARKFAEAGGP